MSSCQLSCAFHWKQQGTHERDQLHSLCCCQPVSSAWCNSVLYENSLSQVLGATSPIFLSLFLLFIGEQGRGGRITPRWSLCQGDQMWTGVEIRMDRKLIDQRRLIQGSQKVCVPAAALVGSTGGGKGHTRNSHICAPPCHWFGKVAWLIFSILPFLLVKRQSRLTPSTLALPRLTTKLLWKICFYIVSNREGMKRRAAPPPITVHLLFSHPWHPNTTATHCPELRWPPGGVRVPAGTLLFSSFQVS